MTGRVLAPEPVSLPSLCIHRHPIAPLSWLLHCSLLPASCLSQAAMMDLPFLFFLPCCTARFLLVIPLIFFLANFSSVFLNILTFSSHVSSSPRWCVPVTHNLMKLHHLRSIAWHSPLAHLHPCCFWCWPAFLSCRAHRSGTVETPQIAHAWWLSRESSLNPYTQK